MVDRKPDGETPGHTGDRDRRDASSLLGSLQRRIRGEDAAHVTASDVVSESVGQSPWTHVPASSEAATPEPVQHATLGLLDGTVIARLACHESLGRAVIGRGSAATIQVHDPFAHRVHAEIEWDITARAHIITHSGGANGTFVNLQRVTVPTRLIDGSRIRIGKTEIVYRRIWYPS